MVSVVDNSTDSPLNANTIVETAFRPEQNPELFAVLGRPVSAGLVFGMQPSVENATREYAQLVETIGHYAFLRYTTDADLYSIARRLKEDPRFAYSEVSAGIGFSANPNDPYFANSQPWLPDNENYQWASQSGVLGLPGAWDRIQGWATVGVMDQGMPVAPDPGGWRSYVVDHPDLQQVISYNMSYNFGDIYPPPGGGYLYPARRQLWNFPLVAPDFAANYAHGTHVVGLIAANSNNGIGVSGVCWHCSISFSQLSDERSLDTALAYESFWGAQIINFSGFTAQSIPPDCGGYSIASPPHCQSIMLTVAHDILYVASSGNNLSTNVQPGNYPGSINFPARNQFVVGVGGVDVRADMWDEHYSGSGSWLSPTSGDYASGPDAGCPNFAATAPAPFECGSNTGAIGTFEQDFVGPARRVLSTVPVGTTYQPVHPDICNDFNFGASNDGYGLCTGTSMSAPLISGVAALIRSVNPLLSRGAVYEAMKKSASPLGIYSNERGWGVPSASVAVELAMGRVGGQVVRNRLTPMFALRNIQDADRLYTTRPQVAIGALSGIYLTEAFFYGNSNYCNLSDPNCPLYPSAEQMRRPYVSAAQSEGHSAVNAYEDYLVYKPFEASAPRSAFWVFTSEKKVWKEVEMKPLHRLSFAEECDWRDHIYTTDPVGINYLTNNDFCPYQSGPQPYQYDAIEGYILAACPPGYNCDNLSDPTAPQRLYRRHSFVENANALLTASQLLLPAFSSYFSDPWGGGNGGNGLLGFVFPNVDTDGDTVPDGMERMYGMKWWSNDSDCDGFTDGTEFPFDSLQPIGKDPLSGSCI